MLFVVYSVLDSSLRRNTFCEKVGRSKCLVIDPIYVKLICTCKEFLNEWTSVKMYQRDRMSGIIPIFHIELLKVFWRIYLFSSFLVMILILELVCSIYLPGKEINIHVPRYLQRGKIKNNSWNKNNPNTQKLRKENHISLTFKCNRIP